MLKFLTKLFQYKGLITAIALVVFLIYVVVAQVTIPSDWGIHEFMQIKLVDANMSHAMTLIVLHAFLRNPK